MQTLLERKFFLLTALIAVSLLLAACSQGDATKTSVLVAQNTGCKAGETCDPKDPVNPISWCDYTATSCTPTQNADGTWKMCPWNQQCYYPDGKFTCIATDGSVDCPGGTTVCSPTSTGCKSPGYTGPFTSGDYCMNSTAAYSKDGTQMQCIKQPSGSNTTSSPPSGYTYCNPTYSSSSSVCLDPGQTVTKESGKSYWCSMGMGCGWESTSTTYSCLTSYSGTCPGSTTTTTCDYDGYCDSGETVANCASDCGSTPATPICGDKVCASTESATNCPSDCGSTPVTAVCGDKVCASTESATNCPSDCGSTPVTVTCGDSVCASTESSASCPADCGSTTVTPVCGNYVCESTETSSTCSTDCGTPTPSYPPSGSTCEENKKYGENDYCESWLTCSPGQMYCPWFKDCYGKDSTGKVFKQYVKVSGSSSSVSCPAGTSDCNPNDTGCVNPGETKPYTNNQWCKNSDSCYSLDGKQITCQTWDSNNYESKACTSGFTHCYPGPDGKPDPSCLDVGQEKPKDAGQYYWCTRGKLCDYGDTVLCSSDYMTCPEKEGKKAKYCPETVYPQPYASASFYMPIAGKCVEPGEYGDDNKNNWDWCGSGDQCYTDSGKLYCNPWTEEYKKQMMNPVATPGMMGGYSDPQCPSVAPNYCNSKDEWCLEPGETGKSGSWCGRWFGPDTQTYNTDGTVTCRKKDSGKDIEVEELKCPSGYHAEFRQRAGKEVCMPDADKICLQVLTKAEDPKTGTCYDFANSCIPYGWSNVSNLTTKRECVALNVEEKDKESQICANYKTFAKTTKTDLEGMAPAIAKLRARGEDEAADQAVQITEKIGTLLDNGGGVVTKCEIVTTAQEKAPYEQFLNDNQNQISTLKKDLEAIMQSLGKDQASEILAKEIEKLVELLTSGSEYLQQFAEEDPRVQALLEFAKEDFELLAKARAALDDKKFDSARQIVNEVNTGMERFKRFLEKYGYYDVYEDDDDFEDLFEHLSDEINKQLDEAFKKFEEKFAKAVDEAITRTLEGITSRFIEIGQEAAVTIIADFMAQAEEVIAKQVNTALENISYMKEELQKQVTETRAILANLTTQIEEAQNKVAELEKASSDFTARRALNDALDRIKEKLLIYNLTPATTTQIRDALNSLILAIEGKQLDVTEASELAGQLLAEVERLIELDFKAQQADGLIKCYDSPSHEWFFAGVESLPMIEGNRDPETGGLTGTCTPAEQFNFAQLIKVLHEGFGVSDGSAVGDIEWVATRLGAAERDGILVIGRDAGGTTIKSGFVGPKHLYDSVTRGEALWLTYQYIVEYQPSFLPAEGAIDTAVLTPLLSDNDARFIAAAGEGFKFALAFFVDEGVIQGQGGGSDAGTIALYAPINRAEAFAIFLRLVEDVGMPIAR